jgi:hypothetical protein
LVAFCSPIRAVAGTTTETTTSTDCCGSIVSGPLSRVRPSPRYTSLDQPSRLFVALISIAAAVSDLFVSRNRYLPS